MFSPLMKIHLKFYTILYQFLSSNNMSVSVTFYTKPHLIFSFNFNANRPQLRDSENWLWLYIITLYNIIHQSLDYIVNMSIYL